MTGCLRQGKSALEETPCVTHWPVGLISGRQPAPYSRTLPPNSPVWGFMQERLRGVAAGEMCWASLLFLPQAAVCDSRRRQRRPSLRQAPTEGSPSVGGRLSTEGRSRGDGRFSSLPLFLGPWANWLPSAFLHLEVAALSRSTFWGPKWGVIYKHTLWKILTRDFCGSPVVKIPCFHCRGYRFTPWSGKYGSHTPLSGPRQTTTTTKWKIPMQR